MVPKIDKTGGGISREYVNKVFDKIRERKPLGKKEARIAEVLYEEAQGFQSTKRLGI